MYMQSTDCFIKILWRDRAIKLAGLQKQGHEEKQDWEIKHIFSVTIKHIWVK